MNVAVQIQGHTPSAAIDLPPATPLLRDILRAVSEYFLVTQIDIISHRRTANLIYPRHIFYYLARHLTMKSLPQIGAFASGRDHTTVLHGVRKIARLLESEAQVQVDIGALRARLKIS